jgi:hypothetical protein
MCILNLYTSDPRVTAVDICFAYAINLFIHNAEYFIYDRSFNIPGPRDKSVYELVLFPTWFSLKLPLFS